MSLARRAVCGCTGPMPDPAYPDELSDGALRLRSWRFDDVACVEQASQDPDIPKGTTVPTRYSPQEGLAFIRRQHSRLTAREGVSLAITQADGDVAIGLIVLSARPQAGVAGIGYWIVPAVRGRGLATRAIGLMTAWGLDGLGFARVEAWVQPGNTASRLSLEKNDFALEGRLRSFLEFDGKRADVLVYSRLAARQGEATPRPTR